MFWQTMRSLLLLTSKLVPLLPISNTEGMFSGRKICEKYRKVNVNNREYRYGRFLKKSYPIPWSLLLTVLLALHCLFSFCSWKSFLRCHCFRLGFVQWLYRNSGIQSFLLQKTGLWFRKEKVTRFFVPSTHFTENREVFPYTSSSSNHYPSKYSHKAGEISTMILWRTYSWCLWA